MNNTTVSNAELVRQGYAAFNTADIPELVRLFGEQCSWHTPGRSPVAGDAWGRDAVFAQFGRYGGETLGTFRANLQQVFEAPDGRVIGLHQNTGTRNGKQLDVLCCIVFEFEDGQLSSGREIFYDLHQWDQFWS
jgi:ketosteroid isomerase-like protein